MGWSLIRFPFTFSLPKPPSASHHISSRPSLTIVCAAAAAAVGGAIAVVSPAAMKESWSSSVFGMNNCAFASVSLTDDDGAEYQLNKVGGVSSFPPILDGSKKLLGVGFRRKSVFGLKNIDVYAFGVYADVNDLKKALCAKFGEQPVSNLQDEILDGDIPITIRLQIVYGRLSISSVRSAFKESVGSRLHKFGGPGGNKQLLESFTSQFKDEYKIPKGTVIHMSRGKGYVLTTTIDGTVVGSIHSKLLCKSILDLYIGEDPFDKQVKEEIEHKLASILEK